MQVTDAGPVVDGVYVNGCGPFRFLVDTGANTNLISRGLARNIGIKVTFRTSFASMSRASIAFGSSGNEISLDSERASAQELLLVDLDTPRYRSSDIQGLLGQQFLAHFDYRLDLKRQQLSFGEQNRIGTRVLLTMINGRPSVSTSLGQMVVDSGAAALVLAGMKHAPAPSRSVELQSAAGSEHAAVRTARVLIEDRIIWQGGVLSIPGPLDPGINGLLPVRHLNSVYICNSGGYVVFE